MNKMKIKYSIVSFALVFCLLVQQSVSQNTDLADSQVYFEKAIASFVRVAANVLPPIAPSP